MAKRMRLVRLDDTRASRARSAFRGRGGGGSMGQPPAGKVPVVRAETGKVEILDLDEFTKIPAFYVAQHILDNDVGSTIKGEAKLRPELFLLHRISWASTNDLALGFAGADGRTVRILWGDEFTKFLGDKPMMLSAIFGDSNGFLDLPREILFNGTQQLTTALERILTVEDESTIDIVFHGTGLLPLGTHQSGSQ